MELIDLNMMDKIIKHKEFTIGEYIDSTQDSESDIEIQVDGIDREIRNYKISSRFFIIVGIVMTIFLIVNSIIFDINWGLMFMNIVLILFCAIIVNLNNIIINKLLLIDLSNEVMYAFLSEMDVQTTEMTEFRKLSNDVEQGYIN